MPQILIVDDDELLRTVVGAMFEEEGYAIVLARDGNRAVQALAKEKIDIVVMDLIMPDKEGLETIVEIRKNYPDTKIIAISGGGQINKHDILSLAQRLGAHATLPKPFLPDAIVRLARSLLENKPAASERSAG